MISCSHHIKISKATIEKDKPQDRWHFQCPPSSPQLSIASQLLLPGFCFIENWKRKWFAHKLAPIAWHSLGHKDKKIWGWGFNPKNLAAEPKYSCYCWYIQYIDQIVWSVYKQTLLPSYMTWWQTKSQGFELFHRVWPFRLLQQFWSESHQACWRCSVAPGRRKHCQRHNGPEGRVHLAKVTFWGHITSSNTNLDHISSSESRLSIN